MSSEYKYHYRDILRESLRASIEHVDEILDRLFDDIDGNKTYSLDLTFHIEPGSEVKVDYTIKGNLYELYRGKE